MDQGRAAERRGPQINPEHFSATNRRRKHQELLEEALDSKECEESFLRRFGRVLVIVGVNQNERMKEDLTKDKMNNWSISQKSKENFRKPKMSHSKENSGEFGSLKITSL